MQEPLKRRAAELGIRSAVTFTGPLPYAAVPDHVAAMDVAVSPKATFYASPMKILEYMAMGKAVVAPDMDNIRDIVEPNVTGVLFERDSVDALRKTLDVVVTRGAVRERIGTAARRAVEQRYNWRHNAAEVVRLAEQAVRGRDLEPVARTGRELRSSAA